MADKWTRKLTADEQATALKLILKNRIPDKDGARVTGFPLQKYRRIISGQGTIDKTRIQSLFENLRNYESTVSSFEELENYE
tara:strand:- start:3352 stop:3597 length:246 start_codon:yes stop_codon:yes gene_type:complete